jgi:hypothetical protein
MDASRKPGTREEGFTKRLEAFKLKMKRLCVLQFGACVFTSGMISYFLRDGVAHKDLWIGSLGLVSGVLPKEAVKSRPAVRFVSSTGRCRMHSLLPNAHSS